MPENTSIKRTKPFVASYVRIADDLRNRITDGGLRPDEMLPGMRRLAEHYGVAVGTVQQAVAILVEEGQLRSDGWRGTFVAENPSQSETESSANGSVGGDTANPQIARLRGTVGIIAAIPHNVSLSSSVASDLWPVTILHAFERSLAAEPLIVGGFVNLIRDDGSLRTGSEAAQSLRSDGVDALALIRWSEEKEDDVIADIAREIPVVIASASVAPVDIPFVAMDNRAAGYDAGAHMIRAGYRKFLFLAPMPSAMTWQDDRIGGVRHAMNRAKLPADSLTVFRGKRPYSGSDYQPNLGHELGEVVLAEQGLRDVAVFAANDNIAYGFRRAALEEGYSPGEHYGLIAFDDRAPSREIGLTSLAPPLHSIGEQTAHMLLQFLRGDRSLSQVWLRPHLINRSSSQQNANALAVDL